MIKLIAFDLDGTLTQHKTPLDAKNRAVLDKLAEKVYRAENMTAMEYINMVEDDNYSRYECWVVEVEFVKKSNPLEKAIEEVKRVDQREDSHETLKAIRWTNRIDDGDKEDEE